MNARSLQFSHRWMKVVYMHCILNLLLVLQWLVNGLCNVPLNRSQYRKGWKNNGHSLKALKVKTIRVERSNNPPTSIALNSFMKHSCFIILATSNLSGMWPGLGVQWGRKRRERHSQLSVTGNLWPAEGAACLLLQPGVLQEAGGAEEQSPEEHGWVGEDVHQPRQGKAWRGRWRTSGKKQRGQAAPQVGYALWFTLKPWHNREMET